jgi:hypothetical protein
MTAIEQRRLTSARRTALLAAAGVLLSACHVTVGAPTPTNTRDAVHKNVIEQVTAQQVRDQLGGGPVVITCPQDLALKIGASEECQLAQDGKRFPLTVTITKTTPVDDASWNWHIGQQLKDS